MLSRLALLSLFAVGCIPELPEVERPCAMWEEPGLFRFTVHPADGGKRRPYVWVPASKGPRDVVVALHGAVENGRDFSDTTNLIALADKEGFVVVFPEGKGTLARFWNAGQCCGSAARGGVPDIAFLDQLVDELSPAVCGGRVLGTGFSNGGMMVHRWACQGRTLDGAVPVSGPLEASLQNCDGPPMPILHIHGAADPLVPWQGGQGNGITDHRYRSVEETMGVWRERNRCTDAEPQLVLGNGVSCTNWECEAPTSMCLIDGWGHAWPGGRNGAAALDAGVEGYAWFDLSVAP